MSGIENPYPAKIPPFLKGRFTQAEWEQAVNHRLRVLAIKQRESRRKTRKRVENAWENIAEMTPDQAQKFQQLVDETQAAMRKQEKERHKEAEQLAKKIFRPTPEFETIIRKHAIITLTLEQSFIYENLLALQRMMTKSQNISGDMRASFIDVAEKHCVNEQRIKKLLTSPRLWKAKVNEALRALRRRH